MKLFTNVLIITFLIIGCKKKSITTKVVSKNDKTNIVGKNGNGVTDIDGNNYKTVIIGNQEWMAENLKVTRYNDASSISNVTNDTEWQNINYGAWSIYNNDNNYNATYGKLYNFYAVNSSSNLNVCPTGWHVPSDNEWTILTDYLGGDTVAGGKMKEVGIEHWKSPNVNATNSSLFNGIPSGFRGSGYNGSVDKSYYALGVYSYWWSSTMDSSNIGWLRGISNENASIIRFKLYGFLGFSIRCLRN